MRERVIERERMREKGRDGKRVRERERERIGEVCSYTDGEFPRMLNCTLV